MAIEDLHALTPIPELGPDSLGVPPAPMAPPALPPAPQLGQPVQANRNQRLLTLAALASMIAGGKATSGLGAGILSGQQRMENERQQREAVQINERRYQEQQAQEQQIRFQRERQIYQQQLQQRQQTLMGAVNSIRQQVGQVKDKATYDQQMEGYANLLRSSGYRVDSNWLRQAAPFVAPNSAETAGKMIDTFQKDPINKGLLARPDLYVKQKWRIDANGDGIAEEYDTPEFYALAGRGFAQDPETGAPIEVPAELTKPGTPFQEILTADLQRFRTENKRDPNPQEKQQIVSQAIATSKEKPDSGMTGLAAEMAAARLDLLKAQAEKAKSDAIAAQAKNAPPHESPYAQERTQRIAQAVDRLLMKVSGWTTGAGAMLSSIPATDARNFKAELNTLKSNIAFGELAEMRAASKTGGALGAVSDRETALLESALGALDTGQSPENFRQQLHQIKASLLRWEEAKRGGASPAPAPQTAPTTQQAAPSRTYGKYTFRVK